MDSEELFIMIAEATVPSVLGARRPTREELLRRGKRWVSDRRDDFCILIRSHPVQQVFKQNINNEDDQIRALIDVVASVQWGIPPMVIAKAIIILGESWFCQNNND